MPKEKLLKVIASLLIASILAYLAIYFYMSIFRHRFLPSDYYDATHLYEKEIGNCNSSEYMDTVDILHKYPGIYLLTMDCFIPGLYAEMVRLINENKMEESDSVSDIIKRRIDQDSVRMSYTISVDGKVVKEEEYTKMKFYCWNAGAQSFEWFNYNVPKDIPKNKNTKIQYTLHNCSEELLRQIGKTVIRLEKISGDF